MRYFILELLEICNRPLFSFSILSHLNRKSKLFYFIIKELNNKNIYSVCFIIFTTLIKKKKQARAQKKNNFGKIGMTIIMVEISKSN